MVHGALPSTWALAIAMVLSITASPAAGQAPAAAAKTTTAAAGWTPARTPDGQPDIQGIWINYDTTPFETPNANDPDGIQRGAPGTGPSGDFADSAGRRNARRPSLVVDPPDGRVAVMAAAEAKREYDLAHLTDSWENHTMWERCITRGVPGGIFPAGYGAGYQIIQGPGHVVILYEMIHEARIIPIDGRPHLPSSIRQWNGDSRGRWEGNTLVVEVTNYNDKGSVATNAATGRLRNLQSSEQLHVVERFTAAGPDRIDYQVTITDPKAYAKPWTVAIPLNRDSNYQLFEYACHEGNYALPNSLAGSRAEEKAAAKGASQSQR
jgi:hypothetical protein